MATKIYVGNLNKKVTPEDLKGLFAKHGNVQDAYLVNDKESGESRGFGFVFMVEELEAKAAIRVLNGTIFLNSKIKVSESLPKKKKGDAADAKPRGPLGPGPQRRFSNRPPGRGSSRRGGFGGSGGGSGGSGGSGGGGGGYRGSRDRGSGPSTGGSTGYR